jgi:pimeloyl-ACP methyl ester carboxylesterase
MRARPGPASVLLHPRRPQPDSLLSVAGLGPVVPYRLGQVTPPAPVPKHIISGMGGAAVDIYRSRAGARSIASWCRTKLDEWPIENERLSVDTSLGTTSVVVAGRGQVPLVVLPGTGLNTATGLAFATLAAEHHRTLLVDLPGQPGLSAPIRPRRHRLFAYGRWLAEVLAAAPVEGRPIVVGHSLGAAVALAGPTEAVRGLVLLDPGGIVRLWVTPRVMSATTPWLLAPTPSRSVRLLRLLHADGYTPSPALVQWMTLVARHTWSSLAPAPLPEAALRRWARHPVTVATGAEDIFLPPHRLGPAVANRLHTNLAVIPHAGHFAHDEQPAAVLALVNDLSGRL